MPPPSPPGGDESFVHRDAAPDERAAIVDRARERRFRRVLGHGRASASARARGAARVERPRDGDVRPEPSVAPSAVAARRRRVERSGRAGKGARSHGGRRQRDQEILTSCLSRLAPRRDAEHRAPDGAAARRRMAAATSRAPAQARRPGGRARARRRPARAGGVARRARPVRGPGQVLLAVAFGASSSARPCARPLRAERASPRPDGGRNGPRRRRRGRARRRRGRGARGGRPLLD